MSTVKTSHRFAYRVSTQVQICLSYVKTVRKDLFEQTSEQEQYLIYNS